MEKNSIDTILMVEYFKVTKEGSNVSALIMTINKKYAYKMNNDGKWVYRPGLYDYLFANSEENDFEIEPVDVAIVKSESEFRQKRLIKNTKIS